MAEPFDFYLDMLKMAELLIEDDERDLAYKIVRIIMSKHPPGNDPELQWVMRKVADIFGLDFSGLAA